MNLKDKKSMSYYTEFFHFRENKDRLIDKLELTDEQKDKLKAFFKKYPTSEAKIDWNRKDLKWKDFEPLLAIEGKSKSQAKKYGISGLKEGIDYKIIWEGSIEAEPYPTSIDQNPEIKVTIYYPLTFLGSQTLANPKVEPEGITGKWCIAGGNYGPNNDDKYFKNYVEEGWDFFFIFTDNAKFAMARKLWGERLGDGHQMIRVFNQEDSELDIFDGYGSFSDIRAYEGKSCKDFWRIIFDHINGKPQDLTWESLLDIHKDGTRWFKGQKILASAGQLTGLTEWIIPADTVKIEPRAFYLVSSDTTIIIPKDSHIQYPWDDDAEFGVFSNFTGTVAFEDGTIKVPEQCFTGADDLADIILPGSIEVIGPYTFHLCNNAKLFTKAKNHEAKLNFNLPNLKEVGAGAFWGGYIQEFPFQNYPDVKYGDSCFKAARLSKIIFPEGLTELPEEMLSWNAYWDSEGSWMVVLPRSLKKIGFEALTGIDYNNGRLYYAGTVKEWLEIETEGPSQSRLENSLHPLENIKSIWHPVSLKIVTPITFLSEPDGPDKVLLMDQEGNLYESQGNDKQFKLKYKHKFSVKTL